MLRQNTLWWPLETRTQGTVSSRETRDLLGVFFLATIEPGVFPGTE